MLAGIALGRVSLLPRWAVWPGYFLSVVSAGTLVMLTINAAVCLPIARFLGVVWLILAAIYVIRHEEPAS
jgi:hypothetical protein